MFVSTLKELPDTSARRILILRTAPIPQVQWAVEQLQAAYPGAHFFVLGRQLEHPLFAGMQKLEIKQAWLAPPSCRSFRQKINSLNLDLAVMCLNSDSFLGYERVSEVMKGIPARIKLVAGYTREWFSWRHDLFQEGHRVFRWLVNGVEAVLLPLVFAAVAAMPSGKSYMPDKQGGKPPGYER